MRILKETSNADAGDRSRQKQAADRAELVRRYKTVEGLAAELMKRNPKYGMPSSLQVATEVFAGAAGGAGGGPPPRPSDPASPGEGQDAPLPSVPQSGRIEEIFPTFAPIFSGIGITWKRIVIVAAVLWVTWLLWSTPRYVITATGGLGEGQHQVFVMMDTRTGQAWYWRYNPRFHQMAWTPIKEAPHK